jgi:hypothetical protein
MLAPLGVESGADRRGEDNVSAGNRSDGHGNSLSGAIGDCVAQLPQSLQWGRDVEGGL